MFRTCGRKVSGKQSHKEVHVMAQQSKAIAQPIESATIPADDRWSPVHMMMFCTVASAVLWGGIFALARWIFA